MDDGWMMNGWMDRGWMRLVALIPSGIVMRERE
jgi:hypothetical protein